MRILLLLAITACDQLASSASTDEAVTSDPASASTESNVSREAPWRLRWTTPHDGVALSSAGSVSLVPDGGAPIGVFHLRASLSARDGIISADASRASLEILGEPVIYPVAANADDAMLPISITGRGASNVLDLFFVLPTMTGSFVVFTWTVSTAGSSHQVKALITTGADAPVEKPRLGGRWWFSPAYAWPKFRHQDGVITPQPPSNATVTELVSSRDDFDHTHECDDW